jgi:hypothetical protein
MICEYDRISVIAEAPQGRCRTFDVGEEERERDDG